MFYSENMKTKVSDIGKGHTIKNTGILGMLENIAIYQSDLVGYGVKDIDTKGVSWVLLEWKVKVIKRPKYGDNLKVTTWGRNMKAAYTYRDFEIYDQEGNLCVIATSKWVLVEAEKIKITRITKEVIDAYKPEEKNVFGENELSRLKPGESCTNEFTYQVTRRDIDLNGHMHNIYYLDLAYEVLPQEIYDKRPFDEFRIEYKREVKYGDIIKCEYCYQDGQNIITMYNEDKTKIHAIITLK